MLLAKSIYDATYPLRDVLLNLTFLFNFSPRLVDGIVPASWSIGIEMIFYFIFPGFLILARYYLGCLIALVLSITAAAEWSASILVAKQVNPSFAAHGFLLGMPYFCFGLLALHLYRSLEHAKLPFDRRFITYGLYLIFPFTIAFLMFNSSVLSAFTEQGVNVVQSSLWGLPFGLLCVAIALHPLRLLVNPLTLFWGRVSYSLYLTHPGIIFFFYKMGLYEEISRVCRGVPTFSFSVSAMFTVTVLSAVSWVTFRVIEAPGMALGRRFARWRSVDAARMPLTASTQVQAVPAPAPVTGT
jgi:peptidoglycan/LPS O-acetylase OafA/YrhL